jgi:hypothetical protein
VATVGMARGARSGGGRRRRPRAARARVIAGGPNVPKDFRLILAGPNRGGLGGTDHRCPPTLFRRASIKPLPGSVLQPATTPAGEDGAVLVICFTAPPAPARFHMTETSITYRHDGDEHTTTFPNVVDVCVARDARCDPDAFRGSGT